MKKIFTMFLIMVMMLCVVGISSCSNVKDRTTDISETQETVEMEETEEVETEDAIEGEGMMLEASFRISFPECSTPVDTVTDRVIRINYDHTVYYEEEILVSTDLFGEYDKHIYEMTLSEEDFDSIYSFLHESSNRGFETDNLNYGVHECEEVIVKVDFFETDKDLYSLYSGYLSASEDARSLLDLLLEVLERTDMVEAEETSVEVLSEQEIILEQTEEYERPEEINYTEIEDGVYEGRVYRVSGDGTALMLCIGQRFTLSEEEVENLEIGDNIVIDNSDYLLGDYSSPEELVILSCVLAVNSIQEGAVIFEQGDMSLLGDVQQVELIGTMPFFEEDGVYSNEWVLSGCAMHVLPISDEVCFTSEYEHVMLHEDSTYEGDDEECSNNFFISNIYGENTEDWEWGYMDEDNPGWYYIACRVSVEVRDGSIISIRSI